MANSSTYDAFDIDALKGMLTNLGLPFPKKASKEDLVNLLNGAEAALGADLFREQVTGAPSPTKTPSTRTMTPGSSVLWTIVSGVGGVTSETWDPLSPLEFGRTYTPA